MTTRRQSREIALQVLFQREFSDQIDLTESLELFRRSFSAGDDIWVYAKEILLGIDQNRQKIDSLITGASPRWSMDRMAMVDANIMRIAVWEIAFAQKGDVPPKAAINEALEICKKYSTTDSAAFINGVLDQVLKKI